MNFRRPLLLLAALVGTTALFGQNELDEKLKSTALDYAKRIDATTAELNAARERVASEKIPLLNQMRDVENRILSLRAETSALQIATGRFTDERAELDQVATAQRLNVGFYAGLANEGLSTLSSSLGNIEISQWEDRGRPRRLLHQ